MSLTPHTWNDLINRSWGYGPWDGEPDRVQWVRNGFPCLALRMPQGGWCGYVAVLKHHPWFGASYEELPDYGPNVHGGLTFSEWSVSDWHPIPAKLWWFGFDCGHSGDLIPLYQAIRGVHGQYRTLGYVQGEIMKLADDLLAADPYSVKLVASSLEAHLSTLKALDMTNHVAMLRWLGRMELLKSPGPAAIPWEPILQRFAQANVVSNIRLRREGESEEEWRERLGESGVRLWLIGQSLECLAAGAEVRPVLHFAKALGLEI